MKNTFCLSLILLFALSCVTVKTADTKKSPPLYIVEGDFNFQGYTDTCHWPISVNSKYEPSENNLPLLKMKLPEVKIMIYAGTWCGDSKRHVPNFLETLKRSDYPLESVSFRLLDHSKKDKLGREISDSIKFIPTFIIYREGNEIGRIVEHPKTTLEQDLIEILLKD